MCNVTEYPQGSKELGVFRGVVRGVVRWFVGLFKGLMCVT